MTAGCPNRQPRGTLQARRQRPSPDTTLLGLYFQQPARKRPRPSTHFRKISACSKVRGGSEKIALEVASTARFLVARATRTRRPPEGSPRQTLGPDSRPGPSTATSWACRGLPGSPDGDRCPCTHPDPQISGMVKI